MGFPFVSLVNCPNRFFVSLFLSPSKSIWKVLSYLSKTVTEYDPDPVGWIVTCFPFLSVHNPLHDLGIDLRFLVERNTSLKELIVFLCSDFCRSFRFTFPLFRSMSNVVNSSTQKPRGGWYCDNQILYRLLPKMIYHHSLSASVVYFALPLQMSGYRSQNPLFLKISPHCLPAFG